MTYAHVLIIGKQGFGWHAASELGAQSIAAKERVNGYSKPRDGTCVALHLDRCEMVILGTEYAGEMKKGVFSYVHHVLP